MNAETVNDALCNLAYLIDNAQGLAKALFELTLCDDLMNPEDMNTHNTERMLKVWELLRLHNASSRLVCVLSDTLNSIEKEIVRIDEATIEKPDGIPDTETAAPKTCAEQQKKGKSGGAQK